MVQVRAPGLQAQPASHRFRRGVVCGQRPSMRSGLCSPIGIADTLQFVSGPASLVIQAFGESVFHT
jgi:hypothetical protein